jgi:DNA-binding XRE family transcriptional regulator
MQIKIINKIEEKIIKYQEKTGTSKVWIAKKLGISKARLYQICSADNMMLDVAMKFAIFFNCKLEDLFEYEIINGDKNIID